MYRRWYLEFTNFYSAGFTPNLHRRCTGNLQRPLILAARSRRSPPVCDALCAVGRASSPLARNQDDGLGEAAAPGSVASTIPPVLRTARAVAEALQTSGAFEREFSTRFRTADTLGFSARGIGTDAVWQSVVVTRVTGELYFSLKFDD